MLNIKQHIWSWKKCNICCQFLKSSGFVSPSNFSNFFCFKIRFPTIFFKCVWQNGGRNRRECMRMNRDAFVFCTQREERFLKKKFSQPKGSNNAVCDDYFRNLATRTLYFFNDDGFILGKLVQILFFMQKCDKPLLIVSDWLQQSAKGQIA